MPTAHPARLSCAALVGAAAQAVSGAEGIDDAAERIADLIRQHAACDENSGIPTDLLSTFAP